MSALIGFQLTDRGGSIVTGEDGDPTNMTTFEILSPAAAIQTMAMLGNKKGFLLLPIYAGDIENPEIIERIRLGGKI